MIPAGSLGVVTYERITTDAARTDGMPCVRDLRFPVATVVAMVADGMTFDEILAELPDLELGIADHNRDSMEEVRWPLLT